MSVLIQSSLAVLRVATGTTIPDDFLNLYPNETNDPGDSLGSTGFAMGPLVFAAILLVVIGVAALTGRRRRRA